MATPGRRRSPTLPELEAKGRGTATLDVKEKIAALRKMRKIEEAEAKRIEKLKASADASAGITRNK